MSDMETPRTSPQRSWWKHLREVAESSNWFLPLAAASLLLLMTTWALMDVIFSTLLTYFPWSHSPPGLFLAHEISDFTIKLLIALVLIKFIATRRQTYSCVDQTESETAPPSAEAPDNHEPTKGKTQPMPATGASAANSRHSALDVPTSEVSTPPPPPYPSEPSWQEQAYEATQREWQRMSRTWLQQAPTPVPSRVHPETSKAQQVVATANRLARILEERFLDTISAKNLRNSANNLLASIESQEPSNQILEQQAPAPPEPGTWQPRRDAPTYIEALSASLQQIRPLLESPAQIQPAGDVKRWRGIAESMLWTVASQLQATSESDSGALPSLRQEILELLDWEPLAVQPGDPIDRSRHEIEKIQSTREMAPNRVLEVLVPGYRDRNTQAVLHKATVVMSRQALT